MNSSDVQVICSVNVFIRSRTRSWDAVWLWTRSRTRSPEIDQTRTRSRTCSQQALFVNVFAERVRRPKKLRMCSAAFLLLFLSKLQAGFAFWVPNVDSQVNVTHDVIFCYIKTLCRTFQFSSFPKNKSWPSSTASLWYLHQHHYLYQCLQRCE